MGFGVGLAVGFGVDLGVGLAVESDVEEESLEAEELSPWELPAPPEAVEAPALDVWEEEPPEGDSSLETPWLHETQRKAKTTVIANATALLSIRFFTEIQHLSWFFYIIQLCQQKARRTIWRKAGNLLQNGESYGTLSESHFSGDLPRGTGRYAVLSLYSSIRIRKREFYFSKGKQYFPIWDLAYRQDLYRNYGSVGKSHDPAQPLTGAFFCRDIRLLQSAYDGGRNRCGALPSPVY